MIKSLFWRYININELLLGFKNWTHLQIQGTIREHFQIEEPPLKKSNSYKLESSHTKDSLQWQAQKNP